MPAGPAAPSITISSAAPSAADPTPSTGEPVPATVAQPQQHAVDQLLAAGAAGDRAAWDARVAPADAAAADHARVLFDNLRTLRLARLHARLTGARLQLPAARQAALGSGAGVVQAQLTWRLPGESADASATVWLTLVPGADGPRLAGTGDGPDLDSSPQPLWWLGPTVRVDRGPVTVLVGAGQDADRWAGLAARAAAAVRADLPAPLARRWDGRAVVEVPASTADFARVLGADPAAYARTAAVTRPEGPTTEAAVRVVVNPSTADDPADELGTLLTHETVHVATRSGRSPAPLWVVEGLAEHVALQAHPDQRAAEVAALRAAPGGPALPPDAAFAAGAHDVTAAYARAWLACRAVADHRGEAALGRFYAALDAGSSLDRAARSTLGVRGGTVARWADDAVRRALRDGQG
ncbi:basic secretory family protein [Microlunatus flavus]|uniref:Peptidase MA superfamily protein n=1 Tax=Microlunatus flavus TaxID=1036181 RepID=A0A1H9HL51_9ACTN|nr:basic secretory family protein [Microlunatus flavus]SEQ62952.1 hypothetical protein SAMN05421756_104298 [Microlunatus flavus]